MRAVSAATAPSPRNQACCGPSVDAALLDGSLVAWLGQLKAAAKAR
jgi:hypothetical protein